MRLWTLQPVEVAAQVLRGERFVSDPLLAENYQDDLFQAPYHWLMECMEETIHRPADAAIPIWAWHTNYGLQQKPDRRRGLYRGYAKTSFVTLELEVPDELVLLSDFDDWHCVLNNFPVFTAEEEDEATAWPHGRDEWGIPLYDEQFKLESWRRIFRSDGSYVQACFWAIEPSYLVKVHPSRSAPSL
jgi:hypothetical protein